MQVQLPIEVLFILYTLETQGFEAYVVGGAVRDLLAEHKAAGKEVAITDFDFTTNATPEQILATFPESFYENQFGTVSITPKHLREMMGMSEEMVSDEQEKVTERAVIDVANASKIHASLRTNTLPESTNASNISEVKPFEITTFRCEGTYEDHRRPSSVSWGTTIEEDLSRRDFTINAMALKVERAFLSAFFAKEKNGKKGNSAEPIDLSPTEFSLLDPYQGQKDLASHRIHTVGDPAARFEEDALRMLRAIRFSVQLNMKMSDEIFAAISGLADHIQHISWERIRDEIMKMLASEYPAEAIELLDETGLLHFLLPEVLEGKGVEQAGHHTTDVWTHSIDALRECPSKDPVVRLATLLHDVAKPRTFRNDGGQITFYNHEVVGAREARAIAQRLRLSRHNTQRVFLLVRFHMFYYQPHNTDAAIRRFMRNVGLENVNDILDLREADRLGSGARKTSWRLEEMKARMTEQLHQPFAITDLKINGTDLMETFSLQPGRVIGEILQNLFEQVLENPDLNQKEKLLELAARELEKRNTSAQEPV
jgi:poly(A) polymerase/tRNA nucleotidyltransferase (CCA-adding enzyme)